MTSRRIDAEALLALAVETLRSELIQALPAEKRYAGAMVANAIDIARREFSGGLDTATFALLDKMYEEGEGTLAGLARDIRAGDVDEEANPDLAKGLKALLVAELEVINPRYLAERGLKKART